ncbi:MAG: hypothetical protein F6K28_15820 [Microcoleus sp. SIO2G3]|nr:hypothetical protein [Microcoleus sp. SIO2G3]
MINGKQPHKKQQPEASKNVWRQAITSLLILQALFMVIKGNLDVLSGKSPLDVIPWMITQSIELILKAQRTEKSLKESDRNFHQ